MQTQTKPIRRLKKAKSTLCRQGLLVSVMVAAFTLSPTAFANGPDTAWSLGKPLVPYSARYTVGNDLVEAGQADVALKRGDDTEWTYSLVTRPIGLFKLAGKGHVQESTTFDVVSLDGKSILQPKLYSFRQDKQYKREVDATFNWDQSQIYYRRGNNKTTGNLNANTLDRMTMTVAMMSTLTPDFKRLTLSVFDGGKLKEVELINEGSETINTSLGRH